jgi:glycolate oxidase FAD binding subunit
MTLPAVLTDIQTLVKGRQRVLPRGRGTKPLLSTPGEGVDGIDLSQLAGISEYKPAEYTFTAWAGTPLAEVQARLAEHGQGMPFDPPLVERGASLGGTLAAGLSGPGRQRYGGLRDFVLGLRYVDGRGDLIRVGGKVVKNAAGFDIPKLLVGSLGRLGIIVDVTFKVFPRPAAFATFKADFHRLAEALAALQRLLASPIDIECLDVRPDARAASVYVRLGGLADAFPGRLERISQLIGSGTLLAGADDAALWREVREFLWVSPQASLVKVPVTPARIPALEAMLEQTSAVRRYSAGGQVAWLSWPHALDALDPELKRLGLSGLALWGPPSYAGPLLGLRPDQHTFARRVRAALDPAGKYFQA